MRGYMSLDGSHRIPSSHMCGGSGWRDSDDHAPMDDTRAPGRGLAGHTLAEAASDPPSPMVGMVPIQVQLRALGYDPGPIDGRGGRRTVAALTAYAKDRGIMFKRRLWARWWRAYAQRPMRCSSMGRGATRQWLRGPMRIRSRSRLISGEAYRRA
jgi:hypothetical protein